MAFSFSITHSKEEREIGVALYSGVMLMYLQSKKEEEEEEEKRNEIFKIIIIASARWDSQAGMSAAE